MVPIFVFSLSSKQINRSTFYENSRDSKMGLSMKRKKEVPTEKRRAPVLPTVAALHFA